MDELQTFLKLDEILPNRLVSVKAALLKLFYDKGFYFDVALHLEEIYDNFTFDAIMSFWAQKTVNVYDEAPLFLNDETREAVNSVILNRACELSNEGGGILGRIYEKTLSTKERKERGITYTPEDISEFMIDIIRRSTSKDDAMLDPACGCGVFLEGFYDAVIGLCFSEDNTETIKSAHERILKECIYGCDTSPEACCISRIVLALKYKDCFIPQNIICCDSLLGMPPYFKDESFDWVVTNPPYMGHKQTDAAYKKRLREKYSEVYYEKADLSYCFFKLGARLLKENGSLLFVTGRYFAQSSSADRLRGFILSGFSLKLALDFYGMRPFKNIGIDPMILYMTKGVKPANVFEVIRFSPQLKFDVNLAYEYINETIPVKQSDLSASGFNFLDESQKKLTAAIDEKCSLTLNDIGSFFQGIISGCDKAFVVHSSSPVYRKCIGECGVKWIKSTDIKAGGVEFTGKYLLYTNGKEPRDIPETLKKVNVYKKVLSVRRECANGAREWYELQWGRKRELFDAPKIIFAYKNHTNRFVYDTEGYYFSADVYGYRLNENYADKTDIKKLVMLLNTPIYDAYFKTFAKKLGGSLYEYYPNTLGKIKLPAPEIINSFEAEEDVINYFGL